MSMRLYNQPHAFYAGVDLHARSLFTHVLDHKGKTVFERDLPAEPAAFLEAVQPFRQGLLVGCECMFAWYWLLAHVLVSKYIDHLPLYRQESILGRLGWEVTRSTLCDQLIA